jgi:hypothetical protein
MQKRTFTKEKAKSTKHFCINTFCVQMIRQVGGLFMFGSEPESAIRIWNDMVTASMDHAMFCSRALPDRAQMKLIRGDLRKLFGHCCEHINVSKEESDLIKSQCEDDEDDEDDEDAYDFVDTWANVCDDLCNVEKIPREKQLAFLKRFWSFAKVA